MQLEVDDGPLEDFASSFVLSSSPTLSELRRKFPFEGLYHFRLQRALSGESSRYCWQDLTQENHVLPVPNNGEIRVKVLQLQAVGTDGRSHEKSTMDQEVVDVPEDRQFGAFFHWQNQSQDDAGIGYPMSQPQLQQQHIGRVLFGVKKALTSKMKSSAVAQTLQKHSAQIWEKVTAVTSGLGGATSAPPTALALEQLAKILRAMKTPLHPGNHEHVEMLELLWTSCFDKQPFALTGVEWNRLGFRHGDPMREMQFVLPLKCLVYFQEVHGIMALSLVNNNQSGPEVYSYALVGSQIAYMLVDSLELRDGGCLGSERPFWRLFEDPVAFYELFCIAFRVFDASWKLNATNTPDINFHLSYVGDFTQELLRRGPVHVANLIEQAYQLQDW
ncbi:hypothetical protein PsorP6_003301 [Peronosclerospora sorghi]|uniref:Uncharacterized protein n=1 Tax=Peronosclerospora sorghi TaxID=230839 RepID=A0ACC0VMW5_9STRA|nr:hypothetical protein PsorP6_003301 [Peronosclerospora sorghi]